MTNDEFKRIKEAEKQRLRAQRTLKKLQQALAEQRGTPGTVARMTERVKALFDDHQEAVDALQWDTARLSARLEMLRDTLMGDAEATASPKNETRSPNPTSSERPSSETDSDGTFDDTDADTDWRLMQAEKLVDSMRAQLEAETPSGGSPSSRSGAAPDTDAANDDGSDDDLPEKTIGRVPRS